MDVSVKNISCIKQGTAYVVKVRVPTSKSTQVEKKTGTGSAMVRTEEKIKKVESVVLCNICVC